MRNDSELTRARRKLGFKNAVALRIARRILESKKVGA
jgi:hypothetical protein